MEISKQEQPNLRAVGITPGGIAGDLESINAAAPAPGAPGAPGVGEPGSAAAPGMAAAPAMAPPV